jgi:hypothetical protein
MVASLILLLDIAEWRGAMGEPQAQTTEQAATDPGAIVTPHYPGQDP